MPSTFMNKLVKKSLVKNETKFYNIISVSKIVNPSPHRPSLGLKMKSKMPKSHSLKK